MSKFRSCKAPLGGVASHAQSGWLKAMFLKYRRAISVPRPGGSKFKWREDGEKTGAVGGWRTGRERMGNHREIADRGCDREQLERMHARPRRDRKPISEIKSKGANHE